MALSRVVSTWPPLVIRSNPIRFKRANVERDCNVIPDHPPTLFLSLKAPAQPLEAPQAKHVPDVAREAKRVEYRQEVEQCLVVWVREPAVDRDAVRFIGAKERGGEFTSLQERRSARRSTGDRPWLRAYEMGELSMSATDSRSSPMTARSFMYAPFACWTHDCLGPEERVGQRRTQAGRDREVGRTSRKSRFANMPRPPSSQSMTGSAYSCIEAVKMTSVYQLETWRGDARGQPP